VQDTPPPSYPAKAGLSGKQRAGVLGAAAVVALMGAWAFMLFAGIRGNSTENDRLNQPTKVGQPGDYEGYFEAIDTQGITGWAWDKDRPNTPVNVLILDHETLVTSVYANRFRQDLVDGGKGDGNHGFYCDLPPVLQDGLPHKIRVRISKTTFELKNSPKAFTFEP
jgi:hypothetical protein